MTSDGFESEYAWDGAGGPGDGQTGLVPDVDEAGLTVKHQAMLNRREAKRNSDGIMDGVGNIPANPAWRGGRGAANVQQ